MQSGPRDRIAALSQHLIKQRSLYPAFPPAPGACIDFQHRAHLQLDTQPDVLILPSPLPPSASAAYQGSSSTGLLSYLIAMLAVPFRWQHRIWRLWRASGRTVLNS